MVSSRFRAALTALIFPALCLSLTGCPDPEGEADRFHEEFCAVPENAEKCISGGATCAGDPCDVPLPGVIDGEFLFTLSASLAPNRPVLFNAQLTTAAGPEGLEFDLVLQPLAAADRSTPVGDPIIAGPASADPTAGCFSFVFPELRVTGEANPISGTELVVPAETPAVLIGQLCSPGDFICGDVEGNVSQPIPFDLSGSTFTFEKLAAPGVYPDLPTVDCDGTLADPL
jgi:hypothetical protein